MAMEANNNISNGDVSSWSSGNSAEKPTKTIRVDRESTVFPARQSHRHNINLSSLDLMTIMVQYNQKGLLYKMPAHRIPSAVDLLEKSLSQVLVNFYPLAGRLSKSPSDGVISIDCNDAGAAFIEASAEDNGIADLTTAEVTPMVHQLFSLNGVLNVDGHRLPLLAVQVTKLRNGMFVACSMNHCAGDGTSLWHFFKSWAELCSGAQSISVNPIHERSLFSCEQAPFLVNFDPDADVKRLSPLPLRQKMFHFSKDMIKGLKDRTNRGLPISSAVSSLQALLGHTWQAITRARQLDPQDSTMLIQSMDCRRRLVPPLPSSTFGNFVLSVSVTTTAGELGSTDMSNPAQLLQRSVLSQGDTSVRASIEERRKIQTPPTLDSIPPIGNWVFVGSSPQFKMYETDFGWGKPVAVRSGCTNKFEGMVSAYPGKEEDGSVDLDICLAPNKMDALEIDREFVNT